MKYKVKVEQRTVRGYVETLNGEVDTFEDVAALMANITNAFPNTTVTIIHTNTADADNNEEE
jgi:hypothetical protein